MALRIGGAAMVHFVPQHITFGLLAGLAGIEVVTFDSEFPEHVPFAILPHAGKLAAEPTLKAVVESIGLFFGNGLISFINIEFVRHNLMRAVFHDGTLTSEENPVLASR